MKLDIDKFFFGAGIACRALALAGAIFLIVWGLLIRVGVAQARVPDDRVVAAKIVYGPTCPQTIKVKVIAPLGFTRLGGFLKVLITGAPVMGVDARYSAPGWGPVGTVVGVEKVERFLSTASILAPFGTTIEGAAAGFGDFVCTFKATSLRPTEFVDDRLWAVIYGKG